MNGGKLWSPTERTRCPWILWKRSGPGETGVWPAEETDLVGTRIDLVERKDRPGTDCGGPGAVG